MKKRTLCFALLLSFSISSFATNGMKMIGKTTKESSMGGVTIATLGNSSSLGTNPANIAFLEKDAVQGDLSLLLPTVKYSNETYGIDEDADSQIFPVPSFSYTNAAKERKFAWGFGVFAQGGMGAKYNMKSPMLDGMYTNFGMTEAAGQDYEYSSFIATGTLDFGFAYKVKDNFSVGISPSYMISTMNMSMPYNVTDITESEFNAMAPLMKPEIASYLQSNPEAAGMIMQNGMPVHFDLDPCVANALTAKLGTTYIVNEKLVLGLSYQPKTKLKFTGDYEAGNEMLSTNLSGDADIEFYWPEEYGLGLSYSVTDKFLLAMDIKHIGWKDAMKTMKLKMDGFNQREMALNWDNQIVLAIGGEYQLNDKLALRAGYNYGENPVPAETTIPIFPAVVEHHVTVGAGYGVNENLALNFGIEYNLEKTSDKSESDINVEYNNSESSLEELVLSFGMEYQFN